MVGICLATLLMTAFSVQDPEAAGRTIVDEVRAELGRKGGTYPYFAAYDMDLPAQPRPSGGTETRRCFAESADRIYVEEARSTYTSRILLGPKTLLSSYDDVMGHALITAPADLTGTTPERWLSRHHFPIITLSDLDADLIGNLRGLLAGSKELRMEEAGDTRTHHLATRNGSISIAIGPGRIEVSRPAEEAAPPRVMLRYTYGTGKPPWIGAVDELASRFRDPKAEVHRPAGEWTWGEAIKAAIPEIDGTIKVLDAPALAKLVRRHGYLVPDPAVGKVIEAVSMGGQLHYTIESGGSTYEISQYPKVSRVTDNAGLVPFTRARRKLGDYAVLDIVEPANNSNCIYYIKPNTTLIVLDPGRRRLEFEDRKLDRLIESFAAPKP
jgi:hypothetical protein